MLATAVHAPYGGDYDGVQRSRDQLRFYDSYGAGWSYPSNLPSSGQFEINTFSGNPQASSYTCSGGGWCGVGGECIGGQCHYGKRDQFIQDPNIEPVQQYMANASSGVAADALSLEMMRVDKSWNTPLYPPPPDNQGYSGLHPEHWGHLYTGDAGMPGKPRYVDFRRKVATGYGGGGGGYGDLGGRMKRNTVSHQMPQGGTFQQDLHNNEPHWSRARRLQLM